MGRMHTVHGGNEQYKGVKGNDKCKGKVKVKLSLCFN
jgi:hypothetical protein